MNHGTLADGGCGKSETGAIGVEDEAVAQPQAALRLEIHSTCQLLRRLPRQVEPGRAPGGELPAKLRLIVAASDHESLSRLELAIDPKAAEQRCTLRGARAPRVEHPAGIAETVRCSHIAKRRSRLGRQKPGPTAGGSRSYSTGFEQQRLESRCRAGMGNRAPGQSRADDHDS